MINMTSGQGDDYEVIHLNRGETGLGFNIRGGSDLPHLEGDTGIFVTKIRELGGAAKDGRLKEGDKIIEINGHNLENITHNAAVSLFVNAGEDVKMKVIHGAERAVLERNEKTTYRVPPAQKVLTNVILLTSIVVIGYFVYRRYYK